MSWIVQESFTQFVCFNFRVLSIPVKPKADFRYYSRFQYYLLMPDFQPYQTFKSMVSTAGVCNAVSTVNKDAYSGS